MSVATWQPVIAALIAGAVVIIPILTKLIVSSLQTEIRILQERQQTNQDAIVQRVDASSEQIVQAVNAPPSSPVPVRITGPVPVPTHEVDKGNTYDLPPLTGEKP